jgi:protein gp37
MSANSKIEWTDHTFNPWEGCQKVGPGCDHCYAETRNARFAGGTAINWGPGAPRRRTTPANWKKPLAWNATASTFVLQQGHRPRVFCASLADVFDNAVPDEWRADLFRLIEATPNLDWLLLTKRIGNVGNMLPIPFNFHRQYPNVWIGITVVNQTEADRDIPKLLELSAAKRFLSIEPLLAPMEIDVIDLNGHSEIYPLRGTTGCEDDNGDPVSILPALDWVIVGGESGAGARPMHPDWARSLRDQCGAAGVPFLFKQWGEWGPDELDDETRPIYDYAGVLPSGDAAFLSQGYKIPFDDALALEARGNVRLDGRTLMVRAGKKAAGRILDGRTWDEVPS